MENKYKNIIEQAYKLQKENKFEEAKNIYKKLLEVCSDNINLYINYAHLNYSLKKYEIAIEYYHKALNIDFKNFNVLFNLAVCFRDSNQLNFALEYALKAFDIKPDDYDNLLNLAGLYSARNEIEPEFYYLSKAAFLSNNPQLYFNCGLLAEKANNLDLAIEFFQKVLEFDSDNTDAMAKIAIIYTNYDKKVAAEMFKELLNNDSNNDFYLINLVFLYSDIEMFKESLYYAEKLVKLYPDNFEYNEILATCYADNNLLIEALETSKKSYDINPNNIHSALNYVKRLSAVRKEDEALKIISEFSDDENMQRERAEIILRKRDFELGKELYKKIHSTLATKDKIDKNLKYHFKMNNGFQKYKMNEEKFLQCSDYIETEFYKNRLKFKQKELVHEDINDKNILVYAQNGAGDFLLSSRYFHFVDKKAKNFIVVASDSMRRLVEFNFPKVKFYNLSDYIDKDCYDYATPEMCLIYNFDMNFYNIPFSEGYLKVDHKIIHEKSKLFKNIDSKKLKIGLFWQGNPMLLKNRSVLLENFIPLINSETNQVFSFQLSDVDKVSHELKSKLNLIDLAPYITDYMDTAALLKNIDVLITIDSSIAHLAGAIGVKTILMLPYDSEWRWFDDTNSTPWYNSVKIFKQDINSSWKDVISRIMEYLKEEYESKI